MYHSGYIKQHPGCLVERAFCHRHFNELNVSKFRNFRYKITEYSNHLNSANNFACTIEETEEFQGNVGQANISSLLEGTLTLMAIEKISKTWLCLKCNKPMEVNQEKKVVRCGMCNVVNKVV